jgi:chromosome segregation ATPase|mmetsp:Transcript_116010/g.182470  ORF Transcript_116010/g.182470 Transcript_116010/m.182470 type:complete len:729 (+) Transcript_116010:79-2265(+)|eukprot:CAMPEP_0169117642 /NCGR_PEP_ID=MMETSP1015-20121227/30574_1 /TAXON_ID=342587 /ORGANISM="Karlodinium micrum, Strain CCMP2283" /LENGTH=728 /DNA_ID=CAMNT_0009180353 /DNA_START=59 /DNA_END=2245 /DNA_ORIENTATION=-
MKLAVTVLFVLIGSSVAISSGTGAKSPVERIVKLLSTMQDQVEADGKAEQQIYDKYACWCEKTSQRKADDIDQARLDLRALGQQILTLKGQIATLTAEIAELKAHIEEIEKEQEQLTSIRQKENAAWMAESAETKEALAALQEAITVLAAATIKQTPASLDKEKGGAFIQNAELMQSRSAVAKVLTVLPTTLKSLPVTQISLLSEFSKARAGYAPQSATIQGMLQDMYSTFSKDLEEATLKEADQNEHYEKVMAEMEEEKNKLQETLDRKTKEKAEAEALLADATKAYDDTQKQLEADIVFFDQTKAACVSKHEEWEERKKMRDEELLGIKKALSILTQDENRELFDRSIKPGVETGEDPSFLQIGSKPSSMLQTDVSAPAARAYKAIKEQAKKSHSVRLAVLAVQVRSAKVGHFDKVIAAIDEMIQTLKDEGQADIAKKDQCLGEYQKITQKVEKLEWLIKNNVARIDKLEQLIELRKNEREETIAKMDETKQYMADITKEREEEHDEFMKAKKDDEDTLAVLEKASFFMSMYYKKNNITIGPIQGSVKFLQEDPVFNISEDQAPEADFSGKGKRKNQAKDILSLFAYIMEDVADEIKAEVKIEEKAQAEYEEEMATAQKLWDELDEKRVNLEDTIAKRQEQKADETKDMNENNRDLDEERDYKAKIKPDCDWIVKAFDERAVARASEMDGLVAAKDFLAGEQALVQTPKTFDDERLSSIHFLGLQK